MLRRLLSPKVVSWLANHPLAPGFELKRGDARGVRGPRRCADEGNLTYLIDATRASLARVGDARERRRAAGRARLAVGCRAMRAVQIEEFGGPEVLQVVDVPKPEPGEGEVLIEVSRAGMNFADTHQRENSYLARYELPLVLGGEVAGTTPDGRRVVALLRAAATRSTRWRTRRPCSPIPDGLDEGAALALLIQGLTAWHLFRTSAKLAAGESRGGGVGRGRGRVAWRCSWRSPSVPAA